MKILNLVFVGLVAIFFTACSTKPKCDDKEVLDLTKTILLENGAAMVMFEALNSAPKNSIPNMSKETFQAGYENFSKNINKDRVNLNFMSGYFSYDAFKALDTSKLSKEGLEVYKLLDKTIKDYFKVEPFAVMTAKQDDEITYCKMQASKDTSPLYYSVQYTNDGKLYVEVETN